VYKGQEKIETTMRYVHFRPKGGGGGRLGIIGAQLKAAVGVENRVAA
jgi:hypothetical protein